MESIQATPNKKKQKALISQEEIKKAEKQREKEALSKLQLVVKA